MKHGNARWVFLVLSGALLGSGAQAVQVRNNGGSPTDVGALAVQVERLLANREPAEAIPIAERVVAIRENEFGPNHIDTAAALDLLGQSYRQAYYDAQAMPVITRALAIREGVLGPDHLNTAASTCNLAELYLSSYRFKEAEALFRRCLRIREKVLGTDHPLTALSLNGLARAYTANAKFPAAESFLLRALAIQKKALGPEHLDTADTLDSLGALYNAYFASKQAEPLIRQALSIREKKLRPDHPIVAGSLYQLGRLYNSTFSLSLAESVYQRALLIREKAPGEEYRSTAPLLQGLAIVYKRAREFSKSEELFKRALALYSNALGSDSLPVAVIMTELGEVRTRTGDYAGAKSLLKRSLDLEEKLDATPDLIASTARLLASAHFHLDEGAAAEPLLHRSLALREQLFGPDSLITVYSRLEVATLYWSKGDTVKALSLFQRCQLSQLKNNEEYVSFGSEARKQAYVLKLLFETNELVTFSLAVRGRDSVALGINGVLQYKGRALDAMSDSVATARQNRRPGDRLLFDELEAVTGQISMLTYGEKSLDTVDESKRRIGDLRLRQEELESLLAERNSGNRTDSAPITLANVRRMIPENAALVEWFRYTPVDPRSMFSDTTAWGTSKPRYVAYVIKRAADPVAVDLGEADEIESLVNDFRRASGDPNNGSRSILTAMSEKLLKPLSRHFADVDQLLLSPDGAVNLVPMAALTTEKGEYLAQRFEISFLTSARDLLRFKSDSRSPRGALIVAAANFGPTGAVNTQVAPSIARRSADVDRKGLMFRPLANTALEALEVKRLLQLSDADVLMGDDATEANLKKLHGPRILHIASHAFSLSDRDSAADKRTPLEQQAMADDESPLLRSGIALSGANARRSGAKDDGILTALEAAQLDLHGTELVVLSACDTGVGDVQNGEGVYGLRRALILAGAQASVTSLWKISDDATRRLMTNYYRRLLDGEGRAAALRHAQLSILSDPDFSHPYYWAGFVSAGNWTPIANASTRMKNE